MKLNIAVLPGDGIGPEIMKEGVKVMKGVTIGHNSVVGMGSIVTKDISQHSIAAGNPAKVVKNGVDWKFGFIDI